MLENRNFYVKFDDPINDELGINPSERTLDELFDKGIINLDKDCGPTSAQAADNLKKILKSKKVGHSGTLDPKVTGVLLCGLGRATRLMEYMLKSNKEYVCLCFFHKEVSLDQINEVFNKFTGEIMQMPPIVSAVKRELRPRTIYSIDLLDVGEDNKHVLFKVACQHGTYIRKLCTDMGEYLGINAQMKELRRTKAGPLREEDDIISLDKLRNLYSLYLEDRNEIYEKELRKYIKPMEVVLRDFKSVVLRDTSVFSVCHGRDLAIPGISKIEMEIKEGEEIAMFTQKGELVGMGRALMDSKEMINNDKGIAIKLSKIFMNIDYYPNFE